MTQADTRKQSAEQRLAKINRAVTSSVDEFNKLLQDSITLMGDELLAFQHQIALDALRRIVNKTPVGNPDLWKSKPPKGYVGGRARGNWQLTVNAPSSKALDKIRAPEEVRAEGDAILAVELTRVGQIVFVANNLDYVAFLEDGSSTQAPHGMVRITVKELEGVVAR